MQTEQMMQQMATQNDQASGQAALDIIKGMMTEPIVGTVYHGKVKSIVEFGAFVEYLPGKEGLLHISELEHFRVGNVEDVLQMNEEVDVKLVEIDGRTGKVRLSRKALLPVPEGVDPNAGSRGGSLARTRAPVRRRTIHHSRSTPTPRTTRVGNAAATTPRSKTNNSTPSSATSSRLTTMPRTSNATVLP